MFASREDAGRRLGESLEREGVRADLVVGLPRGGVVVAAETAHRMGLPLDVIVVRKIGHPLQREFAVGALAEGGVVLLNERTLAKYPQLRSELKHVISEEKERLMDYCERFHRNLSHDLSHKTVILVDDGLATGSTMEAAVSSARKLGADRVIVAVPVASDSAVARISRVADDVHALEVDPAFDAVGRYYEEFLQTTDEEVLQLLHAEAKR